MKLSESLIISALEEVMDPEIPTLSVWDLGIVTEIKSEENKIEISLTPTFSGCPAIQLIESLVENRLKKLNPDSAIIIKTEFNVQWNTNMISEKGRMALLKHGLAPPPKHNGYIELDILSKVACPFCGSFNTEIKSPFGPTLCRSLHYCKKCNQAFEQFKPLD